MSTAILKYDAACRAIAEAKTVDEVSDWIDKAAAVREYGRRIKNRQIEIDAIEIRVRAKKRRGELLIALRDIGQIKDGRKKQSSENDRFTLEDLGLTKNESSEEQAIAKIEEDAFERMLARCRAYAEMHPEKHSFDVLNPPPESGPINGARAVMGSRAEPADSLDYFPTPPYATRALLTCVLPHLGVDPSGLSAWEPACGEGHIAEVLTESFREVEASDIHDYGYGRVADFLETEFRGYDFIITNPPFRDLAESFVHRAIDMARVGVAMFLRLQWLDSEGRYERVFQPRPPTLIAFFAERVPLHKGRWEPDGSTASVYMWLVWLKGEAPRPPFWIPPVCRDTLTAHDDVLRFTARPVMKRTATPEGPANG